MRLVYGTLDDAEVLENEAAQAEIVLHFASSDHVGAAEAISRGLKKSGGYWIHTSGTDILLLQPSESHEDVKTFDDWDGIKQCTSRPDSAPHRPVDKVVLAVAASSTVKTAIICPSLIYGEGRGPGNQRSMQAYELSRLILERGAGFVIGKEDYMWFNVHIYDLSRLYLSLLEAAVAGDSNASWNGEGYYLVENGEHRWNSLAQEITKEAHKQGFVKSAEARILEGEERDELKAIGVALWNVKSRAKAIRATKLLDWGPSERSLMDEVPDIVGSEAKRAGIALA